MVTRRSKAKSLPKRRRRSEDEEVLSEWSLWKFAGSSVSLRMQGCDTAARYIRWRAAHGLGAGCVLPFSWMPHRVFIASNDAACNEEHLLTFATKRSRLQCAACCELQAMRMCSSFWTHRTSLPA